MELVSVVLYSLHSIEIKKPKPDAILLIDGIAYYRGETKDYFLPQDIYQRIKPQFWWEKMLFLRSRSKNWNAFLDRNYLTVKVSSRLSIYQLTGENHEQYKKLNLKSSI